MRVLVALVLVLCLASAEQIKPHKPAHPAHPAHPAKPARPDFPYMVPPSYPPYNYGMPVMPFYQQPGLMHMYNQMTSPQQQMPNSQMGGYQLPPQFKDLPQAPTMGVPPLWGLMQ